MPPPFASPCWPRYLNPAAAHEDVPARALSWTEASEAIAYAVGNGQMVVDPQIRFGPSCEVILAVNSEGRIGLGSNILAGVPVVERQSARRKPSTRTTITNISPRLAVMTLRLARFLGTAWGATQIWHMGMGQGRGPEGDPHNSGRAMDFSGAETQLGAFYVEHDWEMRRCGKADSVCPSGRKPREARSFGCKGRDSR